MVAKAKQRYRLEPLLLVKEKHKKQMEIELGRAIKNAKEQKERLKVLEEEKQEIIRRKRAARLKLSEYIVSGETRIANSSIHLNFLEKLQDDLQAKDLEIVDQHQRIEEAEEEVKKARRNFIDAVKDLKAMEKHKELWKKKLLKELSAREQKEMNELGNVMHQLKRM